MKEGREEARGLREDMDSMHRALERERGAQQARQEAWEGEREREKTTRKEKELELEKMRGAVKRLKEEASSADDQLHINQLKVLLNHIFTTFEMLSSIRISITKNVGFNPKRNEQLWTDQSSVAITNNARH